MALEEKQASAAVGSSIWLTHKEVLAHIALWRRSSGHYPRHGRKRSVNARAAITRC